MPHATAGWRKPCHANLTWPVSLWYNLHRFRHRSLHAGMSLAMEVFLCQATLPLSSLMIKHPAAAKEPQSLPASDRAGLNMQRWLSIDLWVSTA